MNEQFRKTLNKLYPGKERSKTREAKTTIHVAQDFSRYPGGRFRNCGQFSAQRFREEFLVPGLKNSDIVEIHLDGTLGYAGSFLEEAFGGLVREEGFTADRLHRALRIVSNNEVYAHTIFLFIREAVPLPVYPGDKMCPHYAQSLNALL